jgi:hypothetical protein
VVFYEFDVRGSANPVQLTIYDSDRGVPPVIFPYNLITPAGNYLGEDATLIEFSLTEIAPNRDGLDLKEIVIKGKPGRLSIFAYNSEYDRAVEPTELPANVPVRYHSIGYFEGDKVNLAADSSGKPVTVNQRYAEARSQLAERSIYKLNQDTVQVTYYQPCNLDQVETCVLQEPVMKTVDFYDGMPNDILQTRYPENIVLAFYASTCGRADDTLCKNAGSNFDFDYADFLHPDSAAMGAKNNPSYFGLDSLTNSRELQVSTIKPVFGSPTDTTNTGIEAVGPEDSQTQSVLIEFSHAGNSNLVRQFELRQLNGQWRIYQTEEILPQTLSEAN